jgi:hypothetical protein
LAPCTQAADQSAASQRVELAEPEPVQAHVVLPPASRGGGVLAPPLEQQALGPRPLEQELLALLPPAQREPPQRTRLEQPQQLRVPQGAAEPVQLQLQLLQVSRQGALSWPRVLWASRVVLEVPV